MAVAAPATAPKRLVVERWRNFVRCMTAGQRGKSTRALGDAWKEMSDEAKAEYCAPSRPRGAKAKPGSQSALPQRRLPPEASPHKLSDGTWPMAVAEAAEVVTKVGALSAEWESFIGQAVEPEVADDPRDDARTPCSIAFRVGLCERDCTQEFLNAKVKADAAIRKLVYFAPAPEPEDDGVTDLPLFCFASNGEAEGPPSSVLAVMVASLKNPVLAVFMEVLCNTDAGLAPGAILRLPLERGSGSMWLPSHFVLKLAELGDDLRISVVKYEWGPNAAMKVTSVEDITAALSAPAGRRQQAEDKDPVYDTLQGVLAAKKPKRQRQAARQPQHRRRQRTQAHGGDVPDNHGGDDGDEGVSEGAGAESDSSDAAEGAIAEDPVMLMMPQAPPPPAPEPAQDGEVADLPGDDPAIAPEELQDWRDAVEHAELPQVERVSPAKVHVRNSETNAIMGTISMVRPGTGTEALAVYCRLHQCKPPLRRTFQAPGEISIRRWFAQGAACPGGAAGRAQHMQAWRDLGL